MNKHNRIGIRQSAYLSPLPKIVKYKYVKPKEQLMNCCSCTTALWEVSAGKGTLLGQLIL